jgi:hypothetical protein
MPKDRSRNRPGTAAFFNCVATVCRNEWKNNSDQPADVQRVYFLRFL